jgi:general secretion pathway protein M
MKDWFIGLDARERRLVMAGAVVLVLLFVYVLVVDPLMSGYSNLKKNVAQQQQTLVWMQQASGQVQGLKRGGAGNAVGLGGRSLLAVVDQSARSGGLGSAIKRIEPEGRKSVKVWLELASFDQMVLWLGKLSKAHQVEPSVITIEPQGEGRVNARLTLLEPGA